MPDKINVSKSNLSVTYNVFDGSFVGDTDFVVSISGDSNPTAIIQADDLAFEFTPGNIQGSELVVISPGEFMPTGIGTYSFKYFITSLNEGSRSFTILLSVINSNVAPPDESYHLKYWLGYTNIGNDFLRLEINQKGYSGDPTEIRGRVVLDYQERKDLYQPIIASSLSIELEADEVMSLQDLYSEDELMYQAIFKRNDQIIFIGFIKPDGIYENWVSNKWMLSIDAYDGLSTLKNLSFISNNGINYVGKLSVLEVVKNCLDRTNISLPINVSVEVFYEGFEGITILEDTFVNTERFYQDKTNIMDCESVLKSTLQIFNASIMQMNGEWWVYKAIDLKEDTIFYKYIDGIYDSEFTPDLPIQIGSQIDGYDIFHCGGNQMKSISASVQAYRIYYKYGNAANILSNGNLTFEGDGLNMPGWTVNQVGNEVKKLNDTSGLWSESVNYDDDVELVTLNQNLDIGADNIMVFRVNFGNYDFNTGGLMFSIGVGDQWFNLKEGKWQSGREMNRVLNTDMKTDYSFTTPRTYYTGRGVATFELTITAPIDGLLQLIIWRDQAPSGAYGGHLSGKFELYSLELIPDNTSNLKGVYYTAQRKTRVSTVTKENVTVYNGDSNSTLFVGTLYKDDQETATEKWYRQGKSESLELLAINAEDNLRISPRPMLVFEGNIFGYIPYLALISINNIPGKFQPSKYSYDTFDNQIKLTNKEFESEYLPIETFTVDRKEDYGTETKVTIV